MNHRHRSWAAALYLLAALAGLQGIGTSWAAPAPERPWKFAVICDTRCGGEKNDQTSRDGVRVSVLGPIAQAIAREGVDLVLFPGDGPIGGAQYGPLNTQFATWRKVMAPIYDAGIKVFALRGNHETNQKDTVDTWRAVMKDLPQDGPAGEEGLSYTVDWKNARFVCFDQYINRKKLPEGVQGLVSPWVLQQIGAAQGWVFAAGHEPLFIENHVDCLASAPKERHALLDALGARGGVYFCGHDHFYLRCQAPDSAGRMVTQLLVGSGGAPMAAVGNEARNRNIGHGVMPTRLFTNAAPRKAADGTVVNENTGGAPAYFGYLVVTVDGSTLRGEWKALTNYDKAHWTAPADPVFEALDRFTLALPH